MIWRRGAALAVLGWSSAALAQPQQVVPTDAPELRGGIVGRVCQDLNRDGLCSADEPGLPNIRVVLETGQYAITDARGRYHLAAVSARAPELSGGGWLAPGRHRLAVDARRLPAGSQVSPDRTTVELPMGGLWLQDFAIVGPAAAAEPLAAEAEAVRPASELASGGSVRFSLAGKAEPGDTVEVNGSAAEVDGVGRYRISVILKPGRNDLSIASESRRGRVRFSVQRVDVIARSGSVLVVPHSPEPSGSLQLPSGRTEVATTGLTVLRFESEPATRIRHPLGMVVVGASGIADLPVELQAGANAVTLFIEQPGRPEHAMRIEIPAAPRPMVIGLLDLEGTLNVRTGHARLFGRGAVHGEYRIADWELTGELELRDSDLDALKLATGTDGARGALTLLTARAAEHLERSLSPELYPTEWGDNSVGIVPNSAEGRLRFEARHKEFGSVGFGTQRAEFEDSEIGRFQRELFGPYLHLRLPISSGVQLRADGFAQAGIADPLRGVATVPAHDEMLATGGSLYYLSGFSIAEGSETLRVEIRDGLTRVPLAEQHLVRGRDYEIDYLAGRILLARPLSFAEGTSVLLSEPMTSSPEQVLVADYERLTTGDPRQTVGGQAAADLGPFKLALSGVRERAADASLDYALVRARGNASLGPVTLIAEAAQSWGNAVSPGDFSLSDDGGLSFLRTSALRAGVTGEALTLRIKGPGLTPDGQVDAAFRWRSPGFSDREHEDTLLFRQLSLRAEQPFGHFVVGLVGDERTGADPRQPVDNIPFSERTLGASFGYRKPEWEARVEVRDVELSAFPDLSGSPLETGGRTSAALYGRYRLFPHLNLVATYRQALVERGQGLGNLADTFGSVGADLSGNDSSGVGLRVGYGPVLGPLAWFQGQIQHGDDSYYGTYSVDVDGPDVGQAKAVSGARTRVGDRSSIFVEDVAAHDATTLRLSRAIGFSEDLVGGLHVTARYERGVRSPLDIASSLQRDTAGLSATWIRDRVRLFGRAELRWDRGTSQFGPPTPVDLRQGVFSGGAEVELLSNVRASGRINYSRTQNPQGAPEAEFLEGTAGISARWDFAMLLLRYSVTRELPPISRIVVAEQTLHTLSLLPSIRIGSRVTLAAGASVGFSNPPSGPNAILSVSLRPSVRIVGGLEVATEGALRTSAPDGGQLSALRGEVAYRFDQWVLVGLGYTAFGFSGLGLSATDPSGQDRLYVRAELAY